MSLERKRVSLPMSRILELPVEIFIDHIFCFCGERKEDIRTLHFVCKKFYNVLSRNEHLYKKLCLLHWKECFVVHLPESIMKNYYDSKYRNMYILDNKYRFFHYSVTTNEVFRGVPKRPLRIREFDEKHKTDFENLCLQSICVTEYRFEKENYKNDFYSPTNKRFYLENDKLTMSLEVCCDVDNECETYSMTDGPYLQIFSALKFPEDNEKKNITDDRFPRYLYIMYMPGGNIHGYVYEEHSKKPILHNEDNVLEMFDYDEKIKKSMDNSSSSPTPKKEEKPLKDVKICISQIGNPERREIREKAMELGCSYSPQFTPDVTHLIVPSNASRNANKVTKAFNNNRISKTTRIVTGEWVDECFKGKKYLEESAYLQFGQNQQDFSSSSSHEDVIVEPPPSQSSSDLGDDRKDTFFAFQYIFDAIGEFQEMADSERREREAELLVNNISVFRLSRPDFVQKLYKSHFL